MTALMIFLALLYFTNFGHYIVVLALLAAAGIGFSGQKVENQTKTEQQEAGITGEQKEDFLSRLQANTQLTDEKKESIAASFKITVGADENGPTLYVDGKKI